MDSIYNSLMHINFPSPPAGTPTTVPGHCPCWAVPGSGYWVPYWPSRRLPARTPAYTSARPAMWAARPVPSSAWQWPRPSRWKSPRMCSASTWAALRSFVAWWPATVARWACRTSCGTRTGASCRRRDASRTRWWCRVWVAKIGACISAWCDGPRAIHSRPPRSCN